jgi:AcrR family transcriptional regulator
MPDKPMRLRDRQAQQTRAEILRAARRLFAENGYSRTSVRQVAQEAGVSTQTVYDSIGSKQALVAHLNDLIDTEAGVGEIVGTAAGSGDPQQVAAMSARVMRSIVENCGDILHALVTGAAAEPELRAVLEEGHRRHVEGARSVVRLLKKLGALGAGVDARTAAESLAALTDFRFAMLLRDSYGWSLDRVESWMVETSRTLLLTDG